MKRSKVNEIIERSDEFIRSFGYRLPPFAYLAPGEMQTRKSELAGITDARLGWDITDYGGGDFDSLGLFLFTVRNGRVADLQEGRGMLYAEKIMISRRNQVSPLHRHVIKAEDIINRGGGTLVVELFEMAGDGSPDSASAVEVPCDGIMRKVQAGGRIALQPGESVTLLPGIWHSFWAEGEDVLIGEVSTVNDDEHDNIFAEPVSRFSDIEEDCEPLRLLVSDYRHWLA